MRNGELSLSARLRCFAATCVGSPEDVQTMLAAANQIDTQENTLRWLHTDRASLSHDNLELLRDRAALQQDLRTLRLMYDAAERRASRAEAAQHTADEQPTADELVARLRAIDAVRAKVDHLKVSMNPGDDADVVFSFGAVHGLTPAEASDLALAFASGAPIIRPAGLTTA